MSVPKWHFFSLARAETGARGKLSYGGGARNKRSVRSSVHVSHLSSFPDITRKWYTFSLFESPLFFQMCTR